MSIDEMQLISDECCAWAKQNGLNWNPLKSKLLKMLEYLRESDQQHTVREQEHEPTQVVVLDSVEIKCCSMAEYLGLCIDSKRGLMSKNVGDLNARCMAAVHTLLGQKWFSLGLHPKFFATLYDTYVRSIILYGSELLSLEDRRPLL